MSRVFFSTELEGVAIYWRVFRRDGVAFGFTNHDRDLLFDGILHRSAPGMSPAAIRRTASLELDSTEVQGALSHDAITERDLSDGKYDNARVEIGLVDWENLERTSLYFGEFGPVSTDAANFETELKSAKASLENDVVPRTSPTCRARFCGPGCTLSANRFSHEAVLAAIDGNTGRLTFDSSPPPHTLLDGSLRWLDGPHAGIEMLVIDSGADGLLLNMHLASDLKPGARAILREGCDHTIETCEGRFANSANFQGEPFLPGNDALVRYPTSSS